MSLCRGSGVLIKENGKWKIIQYVLSMTVPNNLANDVTKIKTPEEGKVLKDFQNKNNGNKKSGRYLPDFLFRLSRPEIIDKKRGFFIYEKASPFVVAKHTSLYMLSLFVFMKFLT